jgi:hypothetical protein
MESATVLNQLQGIGLTLSVIEGLNIKVQPKEAITEEARTLIRKHKAELVRILSGKNKPDWAKAKGCNACGCKIYQAVTAWEVVELPETSPWRYEHRLVRHWQCEQCGSVYKIIVRSKGPAIIN